MRAPFSFWKPPTGGGGSGYTLIWDSFNSDVSTWPISGEANGFGLGGILNWSDASARTIGKISTKLVKSAGDISGQTYYAKIWAVSGNNLGALLATSDGVTGDNAWNGGAVDFIFSTPFTTTGGTSYHISFGPATNDNANYASGYHTGADTMSGAGLGSWFYNGVSAGAYNTLDFQAQIFTTP